MQVPALLYGTYAEVRKQCRKVLARCVRQGQPLLDAFTIEGMIDTADHPGLLVVDGPGAMVNKYIHFHCYVPVRLLIPGTEQSLDPVDPAAEEAVFTALLEKPWGMLCLLSANNMGWWFTRDEPESYQRYLRALLRHWDELDAEGSRYSQAASVPEPLWNVALPVIQALARLGVPQHLLRYGTPLPPGGLAALVAQADRTLAGNLVDFATAEALRPRTRAVAPPIPIIEAVPDRSGEVFMSEQMVAAMRADDQDTVRRLILAGEPINAGDMEGNDSPLLWAARRGYTDLVAFLLDHGAIIEDRADEGESPLMLAAMNGHRDTMQLLLDRGADPDYITDKGWDVVQFAEMSGNPAVVALLEQLFPSRD